MKITRRGFMGGVGAGALVLAAGPRLRAFAAGARGQKTLVVIFQRGAVDGLAMVPPVGDPDLARLRPALGVGQGLLPLDGMFALHPGLAPLEPFYRDGRMAVVHAVGQPGASRSHFESQDRLEQGGHGGWANGVLAADSSDVAAVALGDSLPRSLAGDRPAMVMGLDGQLGLLPGSPRASRDFVTAAFTELHAAGDDPITATGRRALAAAGKLEQALGGVQQVGSKGPLGQSLETTARLIEADVGVSLVCVDSGGWDTHVNQKMRLDRGLPELGTALATLATRLGPRLANVCIVTVSEFGRTAHENGTGGTDHGTGTVSLVLGGGVAGGKVHGNWPGLGAGQLYEGRDLAITSNVRGLLRQLAAHQLGAREDQLAVAFPDRPEGVPGLI